MSEATKATLRKVVNIRRDNLNTVMDEQRKFLSVLESIVL